MSKDKDSVKITLVGSEGVGKSTIISTYTKKTEVPKYHEKFCFFDSLKIFSFKHEVTYEEKPVSLHFFDTTGKKGFDPQAHVDYPKTDCFLLVFNFEQKETYDHCQDVRWNHLITKHVFDVPIMLVGTHADTKDENNNDHVKVDDAELMNKMIASKKLVILNSSDEKAVSELIEEATKLAVESKLKKMAAGGKGKKDCLMM
eukprot:gene10000-2319_t